MLFLRCQEDLVLLRYQRFLTMPTNRNGMLRKLGIMIAILMLVGAFTTHLFSVIWMSSKVFTKQEMILQKLDDIERIVKLCEAEISILKQGQAVTDEKVKNVSESMKDMKADIRSTKRKVETLNELN